MSSDEEENTHVTFGRGRESRTGGQPKWTRLEVLLAALCVLLATVSVVLVVVVAAQNIHKGNDSSNGAFNHHYSSSPQGRGSGGDQGAGRVAGGGDQGPYTVVPGKGAGPEGGDAMPPTEVDPALTTPPEGVCLTAGCVKAASQLLTAMNSELDPCEDFFEFACGTWNRRHLIPDDMSHVDNFVTLNDNVQAMIKDLLEAPITGSDLEATKKAKDLYASCINETAADEEGLEPIRNLLAELGGWPVVTGASWTSTSSSRGSGGGDKSHVLNLLAALRRHNGAGIVSMNVGPDERYSQQHIVQLDQPDLGMPSPDYYLKDQDSAHFLKVYESYARELALMLGANPLTARQDMHDMVQLEIRLANVTTPKAQRRDSEKLYNRMTVRQLMTSVPGFDWLDFIQIVMGSVGIEVKDTEEVVVYAPEYFRKMADIYNNTPERTLVNYLIWKLLLDFVDQFPRRYRTVKKDYHKTIFGAGKERSRWRECVKYVSSMDAMGEAAGRLFVEKHFDENSKNTAMDMIHNIRQAFHDLVEDADWMDEPTRVVAREKAQTVGEQVGYADVILNDTSLNLKYDDVQFSKDKFFHNVLVNSKHAARDTLSKLREPVDRSQWLTTPTVVNAFYIATRNLMTIPAAILQPPFYNKDYPKSLNYGGIGMVIGHEITHGFDDRGRQYDKDGDLRQWWDDLVIRRFKDRAQCIIDQYSNFTMPQVGMQVNGVQTQGENIADNGGIKEAYRAYRKWVRAQGREEPRLPGMLQYTQDQLFFINFAQVWCGTMRPEAIIKKLRIGPHSPARYRVIGTLQNQDSFSQAFHCSSQAYMNPPHKCSIW